MKTEREQKAFLALGEQACKMLRIAYPDCEIAVGYNNEQEVLVFSLDEHTFTVNVGWSSVAAGVRDIARQLLDKPLYDYI